jgi:methanogenic corrinoid protein MtbC1
VQNIEVCWTQLYSAVLEVVPRWSSSIGLRLIQSTTRALLCSARVCLQTRSAPGNGVTDSHARLALQGNQRLYSERDVAIIDWLRDCTRDGMTISQAVHLFQQEQGSSRSHSRQVATSLRGGHRHSGSRDQADQTTLASFRDTVAEALITFDATSAERIVEEALALCGVESVCELLLQPVLNDIGDRWANGEVGISAEHYASHYVLRKIGALFNLSRPDEGRGPLLAACLEGELHEVGLLLTSLFMSRHGYSVVYLGANLPLEDLLGAIRRIRPKMVLMSASTPLGTRRLAAASARIGGQWRQVDENGDRLLVGFGGQIYIAEQHLRSHVHGVFLGTSASEAVASADEILSRVPRPNTDSHRTDPASIQGMLDSRADESK